MFLKESSIVLQSWRFAQSTDDFYYYYYSEGETAQSLAKNSLVKGVFDNDNEKRISHLAEEGPDVEDYNSEEDSD